MTAKDRLKSLGRMYKDLKKNNVGTDNYHTMVFQYFQLKHSLLSEMDCLVDPVQADLLYMHYIRFIPLNQISEMIGKEYLYTCKLHKKALREYARVLKNHMLQTNKSHFTGS